MEIEELKGDPQFKVVRAGLFDVLSTSFSRTLKKFGRVHVYELTRATGRIVKKLLTGMRMITMDLEKAPAQNRHGAGGENPLRSKA